MLHHHEINLTRKDEGNRMQKVGRREEEEEEEEVGGEMKNAISSESSNRTEKIHYRNCVVKYLFYASALRTSFVVDSMWSSGTRFEHRFEPDIRLDPNSESAEGITRDSADE